ncbi:hypothetical protein DQ04_13941010, partial [Trypanosoma grayi]|uniref:hypothetical protein n=1 Tax=Trypanosoma grayi TaxID=71804 RepID=UPI0004F4B8D0
MEAALQEIVIGTDDGGNGGGAEAVWEENQPEPPALADVEECVASLRALVANNGTPIGPACIQLIDTIVDRLDQVYFWAVEEGTTFRHEPSGLAQCEVPRLAVACVATRRPRIVTA